MQTMGELTSISDSLALMPDPALQQFAQMHKDDPFSLALAVSESNRRRKMRAAQQGLAGMQQQPPVAEQEIAQMAEPAMPENVGIGTLPAPVLAGMPAGGIAGEEEPQAMAGGGMVAFRDGGDVERYNGATGSMTGEIERILRKGPYERTPQENALLAEAGYNMQRRTLGPDSGVAGINTFLENLGPKIRSYFTAGASQLSDEELAKQPGGGGAMNERILRNLGLTPSPMVPPASASAPGSTPAAAARLLDPAVVQPAGAPPGAAPDAVAAAAADTTQRQKPPAPGAKPTPPAAAGLVGLPNVDVMMADALRVAGQQPHPYAQELQDVGKAKVAAAEEKVTGLEAIQRQFSDIFKGRKERLDTREAELSKMKDQGLGLALLQAGATMMSTPGGFSTAAGKGVKVGAEQYASGLEKLRGAQEKLLDARDRLEEVEAQRNELSARELFNARNEVKNIGISVQEDLIKANMQMYGVNREIAMKMVEQKVRVGVSAYEQQQQTQRTGMSNAAQLEAARISAGARTAGRENVMEDYTKWLKENPQYMSNQQAGIEAFLRAKAAFSGLGSTSVSDTPTGKVRE